MQAYQHVGVVDVLLAPWTLSAGSMTGPNVRGWQIAEDYAHDIDTEDHWRYLEWLMANTPPVGGFIQPY